MAERSPVGSSQVNDYLKKRQAPRPQGGRQPIRRISSSDAPPARGLIRKESSSTGGMRPPGGPTRRPVSAPAARGGVKRLAKRSEGDEGADKPKVKIITKTLPDGTVVKKRMVLKKKPAEKKDLTPEEQEQLRLEKERKEKEEAEKRAEEERLRKEREAEEERLRLEREAEEKRKEEERIRLEKEAEQKRIEAEKARQEKERQRILAKIEYCKGALSQEDKEKAAKIAEAMVARNIQWKGYISITSGIGGSVLR